MSTGKHRRPDGHGPFLTDDHSGLASSKDVADAIAAHVALLHPTVPVPPPPPPPPPPPTGNVAELKGAVTPVQVKALLSDMSLDGIICRAGKMTGGLGGVSINRDARPLLVTVEAGAEFTFDGQGAGALMIAGLYKGDHVTHLRFVGPGFTVINYAIGQSGIIVTGWAEHFEFSGAKWRGNTGSGNGQTSHHIYVGTQTTSDGGSAIGPGGVDLTFNDHDAIGDSARLLTFLQLYHPPQVKGLVARRNKVSSVHWGFVGRHDASGVDISDWTISNAIISFDSQGPSGTVKRMKATGSGAPIISAPMVAGTGADANVWS